MTAHSMRIDPLTAHHIFSHRNHRLASIAGLFCVPYTKGVWILGSPLVGLLGWAWEKAIQPEIKDIDRQIILGVLLQATGAVAEADGKFLPEEEKEIKQILLSYLKINEEDFPVVLTAIRQSAIEGVDCCQFAETANKNLPADIKISIIEDLFRVACVDKDLNSKEIEIIKKIADIFQISVQDFAEQVKRKRIELLQSDDRNIFGILFSVFACYEVCVDLAAAQYQAFNVSSFPLVFVIVYYRLPRPFGQLPQRREDQGIS